MLLIALVLALASAIGLLTLVGGLRRRPAPGAGWLAVLAASITWWDVCSLIETLTSAQPLGIAAAKIEYLAVAVLPVAWLHMGASLGSRATRLPSWMPRVLAPLATLAALSAPTNDLHHLLWTRVYPVSDAVGTHSVYEHGPLFFAVVGWSYLLLVAGSVLLLRGAIGRGGWRRPQTWVLLAGVAVPWLCNAAYALNAFPLAGIDPTPLALSVTGLMLLLSLERLDVLDLAPIAAEVLIQHLADGVVVVSRQGRIVDANPAASALGLLRTRVGVGQLASSACAGWEHIASRLAEGNWRTEFQVTDADGQCRTLDVQGLSLTVHGRDGHLLVARDVSARLQIAQALRESEQRFRRMIETTQEGIWQVDASGRTLYANPRLAELLGCSVDDLIGSKVDKFFFPEDQHLAAERLARRRQGRDEQFEARYRRADGQAVWMLGAANAIMDEHGQYLGKLGMFTDITQRKAAEAALARQALYDSLTGLPNRSLLNDRLEQAMRAAQRAGQHAALLLIDLDRFKEVNDTLGHPAGDRLLASVSARLSGLIRVDDTVARLGGDEFAVVLPGAAPAAAARVAHVLRNGLAEPIDLEGHRVEVGASIGVVGYPDHGLDASTLLRRADVAMYVAKRSGSGVVVYHPSQDAHNAERLQMIEQLRDALEHDELVLHYQPQFALGTRGLRGLEALVRWRHPERGLLAPDLFVPLAEEVGLVTQLTRRVLRLAARQLRAWRSAGTNLTVSVNLSTADLYDPDLPGYVARLLADEDVPASALAVEITERMLIDDPRRAAETLRALRDLGLYVSIDDFGTGYNSLAHLKHLPVDELKIDRGFVANLATDERDAGIVAATVALGRVLGLTVVAEGVEDEAALQRLVDLGCHAAQGYHLGRPAPAPALAKLIPAQAPESLAA